MDILILVLAFVVILIGAELFTNGIEWFGRKLELAEGAVGSVLAAVGTALPETMIPIIAILFASGRVVARGRRRRDPGRAVHALDAGHVRDRDRGPVGGPPAADRRHDAGRHRASWPTTCATSRSPTRWPSGPPSCRSSRSGSSGSWRAVLIGIYAWYVKGHFEADADERRRRTSRRCASTGSTASAHRDDPSVPRLRDREPPGPRRARRSSSSAPSSSSTPSSDLATQLDVDSALLALVIAPIATELPEKFNSIIWVRQGKDTLAMGNITGAMVFQSTIPTVVALVFASSTWVVSEGVLRRLRVGRRSPSCRRRSSSSRWPAAACCTASGLLVGGVFYVRLPRARRSACVSGRRRLSRSDPLIYSADRSAGARAAC